MDLFKQVVTHPIASAAPLLQMKLRIRIGTMGSWVTSEINCPEVRRGMEKFKRDKIVAVFVMDEASDAANGIFFRLKIGNNELLESDDVR